MTTEEQNTWSQITTYMYNSSYEKRDVMRKYLAII